MVVVAHEPEVGGDRQAWTAIVGHLRSPRRREPDGDRDDGQRARHLGLSSDETVAVLGVSRCALDGWTCELAVPPSRLVDELGEWGTVMATPHTNRGAPIRYGRCAENSSPRGRGSGAMRRRSSLSRFRVTGVTAWV